MRMDLTLCQSGQRRRRRSCRSDCFELLCPNDGSRDNGRRSAGESSSKTFAPSAAWSWTKTESRTWRAAWTAAWTRFSPTSPARAVRKGGAPGQHLQPAAVYSTQEEFLIAKRTDQERQKLGGTSLGLSLSNSARKRLELWV